VLQILDAVEHLLGGYVGEPRACERIGAPAETEPLCGHDAHLSQGVRGERAQPKPPLLGPSVRLLPGLVDIAKGPGGAHAADEGAQAACAHCQAEQGEPRRWDLDLPKSRGASARDAAEWALGRGRRANVH